MNLYERNILRKVFVVCVSFVFLLFILNIADAAGVKGIGVTINIDIPACIDGLDNDNDGLIDQVDPGCTSRDDDDEFQAPAKIIAMIAPERFVNSIERATAAVSNTKVYRVFNDKVFGNSQIEGVTSKVVSPAVAVVATANVGFAVNFSTILIYLQGLVTQPLLMFSRKRRKQWGVVYSSLTKLPVDLAVVRLFSDKGKLVQTRMTDKKGRYLFFAKPGFYTIKVQKPGFSFPSTLLKSENRDMDYVDLYHGGLIEVQSKSGTISPPIPIDSIEKTEVTKDIIKQKRKLKLQKAMAWAGPSFAVVAVGITPTLTTGVLLLLQLFLLVIFRRLAEGEKPRSAGIVKDAKTGKAIELAITRIFDAQFNKLLETQITDKSGRYAFLAGRGRFYITVEKEGYSQYRSDSIDLTEQDLEDIVKLDIRLKRV